MGANQGDFLPDEELSEEELAARRSNRRTLIGILLPVVILGGFSLIKLALYLMSA